MTTENSPSHTIAIPLGVVDAHARVHQDGTVTLGGHDGHPLSPRHASAAWAVLETWALERADHGDGTTGAVTFTPIGWRELFGPRAHAVAE